MRRLPASLHSLFWRLFSGLIAVMLVSAAASWAAAYYVKAREFAALQDSLSLRYGGQRAVETAFTMFRYAGKNGLTQWLLSEANQRPTVFVMAEDGSEVSGRTVPERARAMVSAHRPSGKASEALSQGDSEGAATAIRTVEIEGRPYVMFAVHTALPPVRVAPFPYNSTLPAAATIVSILLLTLLVAWILALYYTRPLLRLDDAMRQFASGAFSTRVAKRIGPADSEVAALARVFDQMADQIEKLIKRQRRLFHDVSHEVRSPLARIDVALELARLDEKRVPACLERIDKEVREIDRLIEGLLAYARYEGGAALEMKPIRVREAAAKIAESLAFEAQGKHASVRFADALAGDVLISGNEDALQRSLGNIGRNALRFTPEGGAVELSVSPAGRFVRLRCRDQGPGIAPEELERIFDPFVRGAREATGTGFGLGLAITKSAVDAMGGRIEVRNAEPHGLEFDVFLPILESSGGSARQA